MPQPSMPWGPMQDRASATGSPTPSPPTMLLVAASKWMKGPSGTAAAPIMQPLVQAWGTGLPSAIGLKRSRRSVQAVLIGAPLAGV